MRVSVLMPYKLDGSFREKIFKWVIERYRMLFPEFELCLVEDREKYFHKTMAVNKAAKIASGDIFILADADIFFEKKIIDNSLLAMTNKNLKWVMPYVEYWPLTPKVSSQVLQDTPGLTKKFKEIDVKYITKNSPAGLIVITRDSFFNIGGYDERFKGWGCEDTAFYLTANCLLHEVVRLNEKIYHLWHPRQRKISMNDGTFNKNMNLRKRYQEASKKGKEALLRLIKEGKKNG